MNIKPYESLFAYLRVNSVPQHIIDSAQRENHFFTSENIRRAVDAITTISLAEIPVGKPRYSSCAVIMAGNIPLVGFVDMMCCSVLGVTTYIKPSSKDSVLMRWVVDLLWEFGCRNIFYFDDTIEVESVIATGSNNANRYFDLRFGSLPAIKRGSRSSVAVIDGTETADEFALLWHDIFDYFGLGCRNVSHLFIPSGYDIAPLLNSLSTSPIDNPHFINAYRQCRAIKMMTGEQFFDGGYFVATASSSLTPSLAEITYSYFSDEVLRLNSDHLQCVVGHGYTPFGDAQRPALNDWADGVNIFDFLSLVSGENMD